MTYNDTLETIRPALGPVWMIFTGLAIAWGSLIVIIPAVALGSLIAFDVYKQMTQ